MKSPSVYQQEKKLRGLDKNWSRNFLQIVPGYLRTGATAESKGLIGSRLSANSGLDNDYLHLMEFFDQVRDWDQELGREALELVCRQWGVSVWPSATDTILQAIGGRPHYDRKNGSRIGGSTMARLGDASTQKAGVREIHSGGAGIMPCLVARDIMQAAITAYTDLLNARIAAELLATEPERHEALKAARSAAAKKAAETRRKNAAKRKQSA